MHRGGNAEIAAFGPIEATGFAMQSRSRAMQWAMVEGPVRSPRQTRSCAGPDRARVPRQQIAADGGPAATGNGHSTLRQQKPRIRLQESLKRCIDTRRRFLYRPSVS